MALTVAIARKWEMPDASGVSKVLIFDSVLREGHHKKASVSKNPMETGVNMADHAIMEPDELSLEVAVSDTPLIPDPDGTPTAPTADNAITFTGSQRRSVNAWAELEAWMAAFVPFDVITGLKTYKSMMVVDISTDQNKDTSGALRAQVQLQQVLFATTSTVVYPARAAKAKQANPKKENGKKDAPEPTEAQKKPVSYLGGLLGVHK